DPWTQNRRQKRQLSHHRIRILYERHQVLIQNVIHEVDTCLGRLSRHRRLAVSRCLPCCSPSPCAHCLLLLLLEADAATTTTAGGCGHRYGSSSGPASGLHIVQKRVFNGELQEVEDASHLC
ncbi:hypothetical protein Vretimale_12852, partial [Volvox reticuliferus]